MLDLQALSSFTTRSWFGGSDIVATDRRAQATQERDSRWGQLMWLVIAVLPLVVAGQALGIGIVDAWWNFSLGRLMWQEQRLIVEDPFSFTPTVTSAINQQWLAQLAWAAAYDGAGPLGVFLLRAIAVAVTAIALWSTGRALGASRRALVAASLVSCVLIVCNLGVRAQTLAFPIAALTLWALQRGTTIRWLVIPLSIVWANVHGSFPLAPAFAAAFAAGNLLTGNVRNGVGYALVTAGALIGTSVTPYGPQVWRYVMEMNNNAILRGVLTEWGPTTLQTFTGQAFFLQLGSVAAILVLRRPKLPITWLLLMGAMTVFGITAVRNVVWLGIVGLPFTALLLHHSSSLFADHPTNKRTLRLMTIAALMIGLVPFVQANLPVTLLPGGSTSSVDEEAALAKLSTYLSEHPQGRLFNEANWGAYLESHIAPQRVFIDTRYEVHPTALWDEYLAVIDARSDWETILASYNIAQLAIDPEHAPGLADALQTSGRWVRVADLSHNSQRVEVWYATGASASART